MRKVRNVGDDDYYHDGECDVDVDADDSMADVSVVPGSFMCCCCCCNVLMVCSNSAIRDLCAAFALRRSGKDKAEDSDTDEEGDGD